MGRDKRASQNRAQEILEKTGRSSNVMAGPSDAAASASHAYDKPVTSTRKAIIEIVLLYMVPILLVIAVGKLVLKL
jgi:hypothetical protein